MIDKEKLDKLVAEIKWLIGDYNIKTEKCRGINEQAHQYYGGKRDALSEILKSIDTMQKEPKECMYSKDNYTDEDRKALCDGCEEECRFNKKEEPIRIKKGCKYRCLSDMQNIDTGAISFFKDKIYSAPEDNTLVSEENGWLCDISENPSNFELVEGSANEDLEEAAIQFATDTETGKVDVVKQSSFFWGAIYNKQQMMAKAVDGVLSSTITGSEQVVSANVGYGELGKNGDKVKIIIFKEE